MSKKVFCSPILMIGLLVVINSFMTGCSSIPFLQSADEKWGKTYSQEEKINLSYKRGLNNWANGKKFSDPDLIQKAKNDFTLLADNFKHKESQDRLVEIEKYYQDYLNDQLDDIAVAKKKNQIFTMAGSYSKILKFFPDNSEAKQFLEENKEEIGKRQKSQLDLANTALKNKDMTKAQRLYRSILLVDKDNEAAKKGLKDALKVDKATIAKNDSDKDDLYKKGIEAFESKDFIKAYKFFNSVNDSAYKDTSLYIDRTQSKIDALDLGGGD